MIHWLLARLRGDRKLGCRSRPVCRQRAAAAGAATRGSGQIQELHRLRLHFVVSERSTNYRSVLPTTAFAARPVVATCFTSLDVHPLRWVTAIYAGVAPRSWTALLRAEQNCPIETQARFPPNTGAIGSYGVNSAWTLLPMAATARPAEDRPPVCKGY